MSLLKLRNIMPLLAVCWLLAACGFAPVYAPQKATGNSADQAVSPSAALHNISIDPISDRAGVRLRNELARLFSPFQGPAAYRLSIDLRTLSDVLAIEEDASVRRRNWRYTADYRLILLGDGPAESVTGGQVWANVGTEQLRSDFSTLVSERAAEQRAVEQLARQIRNKLALHFATQGQ